MSVLNCGHVLSPSVLIVSNWIKIWMKEQGVVQGL
jgi:hypothetical protein